MTKVGNAFLLMQYIKKGTYNILLSVHKNKGKNTLQTHPCNENRVFPVNFFSQGKNLFSLQGTLFSLQGSL